MFKFWRIKCYEDLNFFERLIYKYRLAKELKRQCDFTVFMNSVLDCRSEKGFNDLIKEHFNAYKS